MFITLEQLGLGKLAEDEKKSFISYVKVNLSEDENIEPFNSAQMVRKGVGWETAAHAVDAATIIGFIYKAGKASPKTLRSFFEFAKKWTKENDIKYEEKKIAEFVEFMEKK
jgi:hypothetical protein